MALPLSQIGRFVSQLQISLRAVKQGACLSRMAANSQAIDNAVDPDIKPQKLEKNDINTQLTRYRIIFVRIV
ncbi:hypothetical protein Syncc8109_0109 [Synechococcus sp. WH 8109]|nr:hypothetical protein Syncc8109_0109 [Synechococcus sp. WH 8109]